MRPLLTSLALLVPACAAAGAPARFQVDPAQSTAVVTRQILAASMNVGAPASGTIDLDLPPGGVGTATLAGMSLEGPVALGPLILSSLAIVDVGATAPSLRLASPVAMSAGPGPAGQTVLADAGGAVELSGRVWHSAAGPGCFTLGNNTVPCDYQGDLALGGPKAMQLMRGEVSGAPGSRTLRLTVVATAPLPISGPSGQPGGLPWGGHTVAWTLVATETGPACVADFDRSGVVTIDDIFIFLNAWFNGDPRADVDGVNGRTIDDIFVFLSRWFARC